MLINWKLRELNLKIVYYGPAFSGKTTNLIQIHSLVDKQKRSELISLKTQEDRTLYFDFLQLELGKISGLIPKIHLYTVPGQALYESSRRLVLHGADGVVFVADLSEESLAANIRSWRNMQNHLASFGFVPARFPTVVQFNKKDLPKALPFDKVAGQMQINGLPKFAASAVNGEGVQDSLKAIIQAVMQNIQRQVA
ncbi:MAG TPA: gliding-motility protein MglA [Anaerolineales bacterium]|nr:gliding-motility protein MglA [Anaerolineales bacterium]HLE72679.1 gliding-motility protein MglA [Anaerolineales bacterium]